jgi:glycosyltransferase involved in cell wall biosynthesis
LSLVLHILPHPGGGAEAYIDALGGLEGFRHRRTVLSPSRSRLVGVPAVPISLGRLAWRARRADLIHVHGATAAMLSSPLLQVRGPSLITTHGLHRLRRDRRRLTRKAARSAIAAASRTICTSEAERGELASLLPPELGERLVVVPNGVPARAPFEPEERSSARRSLGIEEDDFVCLYLGRLERRKAPLVAVEAATGLREAGVPIVLLVAGDGPLAEEVEARRGAAVRALGFRDDVRSLYAAADAFVLPSRVEGMSLALLDAMSYGVPVVTAAAPGLAEAIGDAGLIAEAGGPAPLAARLGELAGDPRLRGRLGEAGRSRIQSELSLERFLARTAAVYRDVLASV